MRDFHSFRVTWVTLALTAGVPLELVQKVTGHKTTDIVLKHYFQPGREDFRQALHSAMPKLLTAEKLKSGKQKVEMAEVVANPPSPEASAAAMAVAGQAGGASPPPPRGYGEAREEMRELIAAVRPGALRERMLKVWAKL